MTSQGAHRTLLPPGFVVRPVQPADLDAAVHLAQEHHLASGGAVPPTRSEVEADLTHPLLDRERDSWFVTGLDARPVLLGLAWCERPARVFLDLYVEPELDALDHRLAAEVTSSIASRGVTRAREAAGEAGLTDALVETGMVRGDPLLADVFGALGFTNRRSWWHMSAPAHAISAARPTPPPGLRIERVDPEDEQVLRLAHALEEETFADHYGNVPASYEMFRSEYRHAAGYDATAWWIAFDDATSEPAGLLVGDEGRVELGAGHVDTLGVRAGYRGRGVASALLRTAFAEYARRGRSSVSLEVDTRNETGAVALYERVGMRPVDVIDTWELPLAP